MVEDSLKQRTIKGVVLKFAERTSAQIVSFVVSIIIARILLPNDYGIIALVSVFISLSDKLVLGGFPAALIQRKDVNYVDYSTILIFNTLFSFGIYAILYFASPLIADFYYAYDKVLLVRVIRVMGLQVIFTAINSIPHAYASQNMQFKKTLLSSLISMTLSGAIGILLAFWGYGVWALVAQTTINVFSNMIAMWITVRLKLRFVFSFERFKSLFSYGWKIFASSIIKVLYNDLRSIVIGKVHTSSDLAFYNKGQSFPQLVESNITGTIDSVFFPAMSRKQSSKEEMLSMLRRTIKVSMYILTPLLVGLAAVSTPLVTVLLTEKWLPCVFFLQIISFSFVLAPVEIENLQAIKAIGRSDIVLKLEIIKKTVGVLLLIAAIPFGVEAIAISFLVSNLFAAVINAYPNRKILGYKYKHQVMDVLSPLLMSAAMYGVIYFFGTLTLPVVALLLLEILVGMAVYLGLSIVTRNENLSYLFKTIKGLLKKEKA